MELFAGWTVGISELGLWAERLWNFEITRVGSNGITIGKLMVGFVLLVLGYFFSRTFSRQFRKRVLTRLDIETSLQHTFETISFYIALIIVTFIVLGLLNIPLTIFTVLGSALAIGVGFGSQTIVNNFISGLVLMIERPVRVGDYIELEGLFGSVEEIGARSTRIKSMDNTHYVVPNSSFLENNVLNWTLSDDLIRTNIKVGVAYGSDVSNVEQCLLLAASNTEKVLARPAPTVIFASFGDNSLNFEIYFWTEIEDLYQLRLLESRVRFAVDGVFRKEKIVIAFPQRDIHLDTSSPLQVEVIKSSD